MTSFIHEAILVCKYDIQCPGSFEDSIILAQCVYIVLDTAI